MFFAAILPAVFLPAIALADDTHYQTFVTGGRAVTLGGAFCAIGNDPSGLLFNPSGIVDDAHTDISLSADLYGFQQNSQGATNFAPTPPLANLTKAVSDIVAIPSSSGAVHTFGSDGSGAYNNAIAFGLFVPSFQSTDDTYTNTDATGSKTYRSTNTDRVLMPGIGYARKIGDFRVGISGFYVLRLLSSDQTSSLVNNRGGFRIGDVSSNVIAGNLHFILGGKWVPSSKLQLGISISLPDIGVNSSGNIRYRQGIADPSVGAPAFTQIDLENLRSSWREPVTFRAGTALHIFPSLMLAADVTFNLPVTYDLLQTNNAQALAVLPYVTHVVRNATANINAGAEWYPWKKIIVGGGFFTDFASSADISGARFSGVLTQQYLPFVDNYGFSATFGWEAKYTTTRVGVMYSAGSGYEVVPIDDVLRLSESQQQYERVKIFNSFFYVFISSTLKL